MMFVTELKIKRIPGSDNVQLIEPLIWRDPLTGDDVVVPAGEICNGASSRWWMWWYFPRWGPWDRATVLHDWLYRVKKVSRFMSDAIFLEAMASDKVKRKKRVVAYVFVRVFGGPYWKAA